LYIKTGHAREKKRDFERLEAYLVLYIKIGQIPKLVNDFRRLGFELGLYIKMEPPLAIPELLGTTVMLNIGRVDLSVVPELAWMQIKPAFNPWVIATAVIGIFLPPSGIVLFR
jgi:hypothetical protein